MFISASFIILKNLKQPKHLTIEWVIDQLEIDHSIAFWRVLIHNTEECLFLYCKNVHNIILSKKKMREKCWDRIHQDTMTDHLWWYN